jgi:hypothetical protein
MTTTILAGDSAVPAASAVYRSRAFKAWGFYCGGDADHVWTRAEVAALHAAGIEGCFAILVPPQSWPWIYTEEQVLTDLVREAEAWPVRRGSPLVLDIEESQAEKMGTQLSNVLGIFNGIAEAAGYRPVIYGSESSLEHRPQARIASWVAKWLEPSGQVSTTPDAQPGLFGWQFAGNIRIGESLVDLSVLDGPVQLMATDFSHPTGLVIIGEPSTTEVKQVSPLVSDSLPPEEKPPGTAESIEAPAISDEDANAAVVAKMAARLGLTVEQIMDAAEAANAEIDAESISTMAPSTATSVAAPPAPDIEDAVVVPDVEEVDLLISDIVSAASSAIGFYLLTGTGRVITQGGAKHLGDVAGQVRDAAAIAVTPDGEGYAIICASGAIYSYGTARAITR